MDRYLITVAMQMIPLSKCAPSKDEMASVLNYIITNCSLISARAGANESKDK